jgi:hypothetical protein
VEFSDPRKPDYPDWGDGKADVVATPSCVVVGTRPDHLGDVDIDVWMGPPDAEAVMGEPKWTGLVRVTSDYAVIGNSIGNHLVQVSLTPGDYQVRVFTLPRGSLAETVVFSLQPVGIQHERGEEGRTTWSMEGPSIWLAHQSLSAVTSLAW